MWATGEPPADAGATLLEMLVVVALTALIGGLMFANFRPALDRTSLQLARAGLAQTLDRARAAALRTSTPQAVELADDGASYSFQGRRTALPGGVTLQAASTAVAFTANGATAGARLRLVRGARALALDVAPGGGVVQMTGGGAG